MRLARVAGAVAAGSVDDLLFGINNQHMQKEGKSDLDILGDILNTSSLNENAYLGGNQSGFSKQWQDMFGEQPPSMPVDNNMQPGMQPSMQPGVPPPDTRTEGSMYMPSFLMEQLRQVDPSAAKGTLGGQRQSEQPDKSMSGLPGKGKGKDSKSKKDMSNWFNLFSDLDPLANPDAIGSNKDADQERSC